jgi:hypothetical protein
MKLIKIKENVSGGIYGILGVHRKCTQNFNMEKKQGNIGVDLADSMIILNSHKTSRFYKIVLSATPGFC